MSVIVVGAGVVGACCALTLVRAGYKVTLIDQSAPGGGCSYGNAGSISPGSIIPMALPGLWKKVPAWLFDKDGPLSVKWSYLPQAAPWLIGWLRSSSEEVANSSAAALTALNKNVMENYKNMIGPKAYSKLIKATGHLIVQKNKPTGYGDRFAASLREAYGVNIKELHGEEIRDLEPVVGPQFNYGIHMQDGGFTINPKKLVNALVESFIDAGGRFVMNQVRDIQADNNGMYAVTTRTGTIITNKIVIAAGAWSKRFLSEDKIKIPLETERGYHIMLHNHNVQPSLPVVAADYKFFSTPMEEGLRLAGTVEIAGLHAQPKWNRADMLLEHAKQVFPGLSAEGSSVWMGHRPAIPDSVPVIAESKSNKGVFYAFGHGHYGLSGAPNTAQIICDLVLGNKPEVNIEPYGLSRFQS